MGEEAPTGRRVSRARQLAERARLMKETRTQRSGLHNRETFSSLRKERRSSALRRSVSSPGRGSDHDIVLMDKQNTPSTVKNVLRRAALARQPHEASSAGEVVFANGANVPMTSSPMGNSELDEESPQQEKERKEKRASFVRRGSVGEYGTRDSTQAANMFCQHSNIPFGHMAASAAASVAAAADDTGATATCGAAATPATDCRSSDCSPSLVVSPHSTVGELEQKLRALAARDERLGRMLGESKREQRPEAGRTGAEATAAAVMVSSQGATGDVSGIGPVASRSHMAANCGRQTESDISLIEAEVDDSADVGGHAAADAESDTRIKTEAECRAVSGSEVEPDTDASRPEAKPGGAATSNDSVSNG